MQIVILGSGGLEPLPNRALISVAVRLFSTGDLFLFDCGEGTQIQLKKTSLGRKFTAFFISHTHADHVAGLPGMLMSQALAGRTDPLPIIGPPRIADWFKAMATLEFRHDFPVEITELTGGGPVFRGRGFQVQAAPLQHNRACFGYAIIEDPKPGVFNVEKAEALGIPPGPERRQLQNGETIVVNDRKINPRDVLGPPRTGRKVTLIFDTRPCEKAIELATGSDLLIHEATFAQTEAQLAAERTHSTARQAAEIARDAGVGRLGLIHFSPRYRQQDLQTLLKEAREVFPNTILCEDLEEIHL